MQQATAFFRIGHFWVSLKYLDQIYQNCTTQNTQHYIVFISWLHIVKFDVYYEDFYFEKY